MGADGKPLRRHRRPKSGDCGCSAGNHDSADTMDTLPTSCARRLAVQRPRRHSVLGKPVKASNRPTSKKSAIYVEAGIMLPLSLLRGALVNQSVIGVSHNTRHHIRYSMGISGPKIVPWVCCPLLLVPGMGVQQIVDTSWY